jgi:methanogenic corrinoid protein MtbC1
MVFLRSKIVKNESYSYLVKSKWDSKRKTSQQETVKYLGKTSDVTLEDIPSKYRNASSVLTFLSSNSKLNGKKHEKYLTDNKKRMIRFLLNGDLNKSISLYNEFVKLSSITKFYEDILRPVMYDVGELWRTGKLDVGDEHIASNTAMRLIETIGTKPKTRSKGKTILICTPNGEYHAIPCFMMETYLTLNGYNVINLAPSAPSGSILSHVSEKKPDLVLISVTLREHIAACNRLVKKLEKFKIPIVIGGQALSDSDNFSNAKCLSANAMSELSKVVKEEMR